MTSNSKTLGILGGMGPYATAMFYDNILRLTPVDKDWDHIRTIIDVNPHIPSRSRHHLYGEPSPAPAMIESCRRLQDYPVDLIAIPCNSVSHFLPEVQKAIQTPILNIIEITVEALAQRVPEARGVVVLGGVITHENRTYAPFLEAKGIAYAHHSADLQRRVEGLIEQIKVNRPENEVRAEFLELIEAIGRETAFDAAILGCTEFSCLTEMELGLPLIDSGLELARQAVAAAKS